MAIRNVSEENAVTEMDQKIANNGVYVIKVGNELLVNREQLEILLRNPEIKTI